MLEINKKTESASLYISLSGRLDTVTSPDFSDAVKASFEEGAKDIILDLKDLNYISSAGLRILLQIQKKINSIKGSFIIKNPNSLVSEVFEATGFNEILTIE